MDNDLKIYDLQLRIKLLEELLIDSEKKSGYLYEVIQDLNDPSEDKRKITKLILLNRGIGVNQFIHDDDATVRNKAKRIFELRKNNRFESDGCFDEDVISLNSFNHKQITHITDNMFHPVDGGRNG